MSKSEEWYQEFPIFTNDTTFSQCEGDIELCRDGMVRLGGTAFPWFSNIESYRFSGCEARRGKDGILVISTMVGSEYQYRYDNVLENWFRRVPTETPQGLWHIWRAELRQSVRHYGLFVGSVFYALRFLVLKAFATYVYVMFLSVAVVSSSNGLSETRTVAITPEMGFCLVWSGFAVWFAFDYSRRMHRLGLSGLWYAIKWATLIMWPVYLSVALVVGLFLAMHCAFPRLAS